MRTFLSPYSKLPLVRTCCIKTQFLKVLLEGFENIQENEMPETNELMELDMKPRDRLRLKKTKIRKQKLREKFLKKTEKFMNEFEKIERPIKNIFTANFHVKQVALVFGMSPGAPKEVYLIQMPRICNMSKMHYKELQQRRMIQLFRAVVIMTFLSLKYGIALL